MLLARRKFLIGAAALLCAPVIVRAESLMPVSSKALSAAPRIIMPDGWVEHRADVVRRYIIRFEQLPLGQIGPITWTEVPRACSRRAG